MFLAIWRCMTAPLRPCNAPESLLCKHPFASGAPCRGHPDRRTRHSNTNPLYYSGLSERSPTGHKCPATDWCDWQNEQITTCKNEGEKMSEK